MDVDDQQQECKIIGFDEESSESSTPDLCLSDQSNSFLDTGWRPYFDTTIFEHNIQPPTDYHHEPETCVSLQRLLTTLYYNTITNQKLFYEFMDTIYKQQIHDDYYHLILFHQRQLTEIRSIMTSSLYQLKSTCQLSRCEFSNRHLRMIRDNVHQDVDISSDTIDSIHFYLYHLYDVNLRNSANSNAMKVDENTTNDYFDTDFFRIRNMVKHFDSNRCNAR